MPDAAGNIKGISLSGRAGDTLDRIFGFGNVEWCPCYEEEKIKNGVHVWNSCLCRRENCTHIHPPAP